MNRIIRWYNQNRKAFWLGFIIIAFAFIIIRVLDNLVGQEEKQKRENMNLGNSSANNSTTISEPDTSVITGDKMQEKTSKTNEAIIKQFVEYCNNGQIEQAYSMLSDECKQLIYPSLEYFKVNYYQKIFYINRMYNLENWYQENGLYTYYITYTEDVMATGNLNSANNRAEYITVVRGQNETKLNISNYIGRETSGKSYESNGISVTVNWIDMYKDYTILNISAKNNSESIICLDTKETDQKTYLYDTNEVKYTALLNENAIEQLTIRKGMTNIINIKFNKIYNPDRELKGIIFEEIVTNYEEYASKTNDKKTMVMNIEI